MKKLHIVLSIFLMLILAACNQNKDNSIPEKASAEKSTKADIESYKNKIEANYFGINNKMFNYKIENDDKGICRIDNEKKYKNGDTFTVNCSDTESDINFKKDVKIDGLLFDDINDSEIKVAIKSKSMDAKYTLVRQNDFGFSLIKIEENSPGLYDTEIYDTIFLNKDGLVTIKDFSEEKMYSNDELASLTEPDIKVTNIKKEHLNETINKYIGQGFVKY